MTGRLWLSLGDAGGEDVEDLRRWLRSDDDLRFWEIKAAHRPVPDGQMGAVADAVLVVLPNALGVGQLAIALAAWWPVRRRQSPVRITVGDVTVEVESGWDAEQIERLLRTALDAGASRPGLRGSTAEGGDDPL